MNKFISTLIIASVTITNAYAQDVLPSAKVKTVKGSEVNVKYLANNDTPTVFVFWATWCVPCIKELNAISENIDDWRDDADFNLYAVSIDDSKTVSRVMPMVNGKGWDYNVLLDTNQNLKRKIGFSNPPYVIVVKNGEIVYKHSGYTPGAEDELFEAIEKHSK